MDFPVDYIEQLQAIYPERQGDNAWGRLRSGIPRLGTWGHSWETILKGAQNYRLYCDRKGITGTDYVTKAGHFFDEREVLFLEYATKDLRTSREKADELLWIGLEDRAKALGFTQVDRSRGLDIARYAIEQVEQKNASALLERAGVHLRVVGK